MESALRVVTIKQGHIQKEEKSLDGTYTSILRMVKNISWKEKVSTTIHVRNRVFSHDFTAILLSQNNETAAMLVSQTSPIGAELFSYANAYFRSNKFA